MINDHRFHVLLKLYLSNEISASEHDEFYGMLATGNFDKQFEEAIAADLDQNPQSDATDIPPYLAQNIVRNIYDAEKQAIQLLPKKKTTWQLWPWLAAASVIMAMAIGYIHFTKVQPQPASAFKAIIPATTIEVVNLEKEKKQVLLSDGSSILLAQNSKVHFNRNFEGNLREVYLEGEAFFKVAKNPAKPFLVYYNNIVTKVLGTSFTINTNSRTGHVEVAVLTGKVQVYENEKLVQLKPQSKIATTIITPNQKAVYDEGAHLFENEIVDYPQKLVAYDSANSRAVPTNLVFAQEKLNTVIEKVERVYGIEIMVESTNFYNCVFTGDVSNLDLFSVLKIITISTSASYEVNGTKILIKGKGCN